MVDTGARPAEAIAVEWRHVDLDAGTVELPGSKTEKAWRTVHLTQRGIEAIQSMPRSISTRSVFHIDGKPISWPYFSQDVWRPALVAAGMPNRAPYMMRHTVARFSLRAGVPIADLAREMGHEDVSRTFTVYGGWPREMGERAAELRSMWGRESSPAKGD